MKKILTQAILAVTLICSTALSSPKREISDLYSSMIQHGEIDERVFVCMGGHLLMKIKYSGIQYTISHSHGGAHEVGNLVIGTANSDGTRNINKKEILLTEAQETLLAKRIQNHPKLNPEEKKKYINSIHRFSIYNKKTSNQRVEPTRTTPGNSVNI